MKCFVLLLGADVSVPVSGCPVTACVNSVSRCAAREAVKRPVAPELGEVFGASRTTSMRPEPDEICAKLTGDGELEATLQNQCIKRHEKQECERSFFWPLYGFGVKVPV